jgi:V/A-type H+/Na+-transporting ATPase subunit I
MILRPRAARWFELLTSREQLTAVLDCLAATGLVELESHSDAGAAHTLPALRAALDEFRTLRSKYLTHWPAPDRTLSILNRRVEDIPPQALDRIRSWVAAADGAIAELQRLANEKQDLLLLDELLACADSPLPDLNLLETVQPPLAGRVYAASLDVRVTTPPPSVLLLSVTGDRHRFLIAVGPAEQIRALDDVVAGSQARRIALPSDLPRTRPESRRFIRARLEAIAIRHEEITQSIDELGRRHEIACALGDMVLIEWLASEVPELPVTENFAWVTGWTSDPDGNLIADALDARGLEHLIHYPDSPADAESPVILRNPAWARPFEVFAGLLGMPRVLEADPSALVALIAPLLFGFMFGDVGQGAVLIAAGVALRRRLPALALLVPGGAVAIAFGIAFGSVFGLEDVIPALWLRPLSEPLAVLAASLALGAAIVLLGLLLDALQHHWGGLGVRWWSSRAGLLVAFLCLLAAPFEPRALAGACVGMLWFLVGELATAPGHRVTRLGSAVGALLENLLQMLVNTISFVRVGAFALAHAGLAGAIVGIAAAADTPAVRWVVLALGNALVIGLEGLIVGIQTTRLVLFEFFIRFLKGQGRRFRPLHAPDAGMRRNERTLT